MSAKTANDPYSESAIFGWKETTGEFNSWWLKENVNQHKTLEKRYNEDENDGAKANYQIQSLDAAHGGNEIQTTGSSEAQKNGSCPLNNSTLGSPGWI